MTPSRSAPPRLSFVIPAMNEEAGIGATLDAIRNVMPDGLDYEILVADHGSVDRTAEVARARGARVEVLPGGTIGSLRNRAVEEANGEILVFLDADVHVTSRWAGRLPAVLALLDGDPAIVTGAACDVSADPSWLERTWFRPRKRHSHIGTGHMILRRALFDELGGFDPDLETGEDFEFSTRVTRRGGRLVADPALLAHHVGYPRTLRAFFWREAWHGRSDFASLGAIIRSRVALLTLAFLAAHAAVLLGLVVGMAWLAASGLLGIAAVCLASALYKFGPDPGDALRGAAVYYVYYWGRSFSIVGLGGRVR